jgi:hypothetical protein
MVVVPDAAPLADDAVAVRVSVPEGGTTVTVQRVNCSTPLALVVADPGVQLSDPVESERATVAPGIGFPYASLTVTVTLKLDPAATEVGAATVMPVETGAPGEISNCALVADGREPSVAVSVYGPPTLVM